MSKVLYYSKVTKDDGEWKADLFPVKGQAFAKWGIRYFKQSPIGWVETGAEERYYSKKIAISSLHHNGFSLVS